ncbi:MAG TPA: MlaD family protein [Solirubrobacteraceae bacterium]|jgi:phospholipid/cholesterol/gamma-HCH transport system substrate-binding protein|nr:MlaD family protein [Solirubrobacteraceae bacterium]
MQKRAPTLGNMLVIILFCLSCFGLLLFLWESFGGPVPLKPKGYQMTIAFPQGLALAEQSDVRISGVEVGHVVRLQHGSDGRTHATIEIAHRYAPIHADMHAILRQKTLLGETYVQLIPQSRTAPYLPDGSQLPNSQVEPSVTLDGILSAFDPKTREAFKVWQQALAEGINERGEQINAGLSELQPFAEHGNTLVGILASQEGAVRAVFHNTGVVFNALASRDHQLEGLIVNGEHTFHAAAESSQAFAEAFRALPTFERNSRQALKEIDRFATNATPFLEEFRPAERALTPLLAAAEPFVPPFNSFLTSLGPLTSAARVGLPDTKKFLDLTVPLLENFRPVLHNIDPLFQELSTYVPELQAFFANFTASTATHLPNANLPKGAPSTHFLKTMQVLGPESLAVYPVQVGTHRGNAYPQPGAFSSLLNGGLKVFSASGCSNPVPAISGPANANVSQSLIELIEQFKLANAPETPNAVAAPACNQQGPFTINGHTSQFPHVVYAGK